MTSRHAGDFLSRVCLGTWITGTEGAVSLVALTTCKAFPWKISVKCVPRFFVCLFLGMQRNSFLSSSPFFIHPPFPRTCHLHLLPRLRDHRRRRCLSTARSQERRHLLCPLCRSLAGCQTEPMPIKSHE